MHKYKIRYDVDIEMKPNGYDKDERKGKGLTDGLIVASLLMPDDGSYSQQIVFSLDGNTKQGLTPAQIFKFWCTLGLGLDTSGLADWQLYLIEQHQHFIKNIFANKDSKNQ